MHNWVYILRCSNNSFYTGSTNDPDRRYQQHCEGKGAKYTRAFAPVAMVGCWRVEGEIGMALRVEAAIKRLQRPQKDMLIQHPENIYDYIRLDMPIAISAR